MRIKKDAKTLGEDPDADYLLQFIHEFDTAAYYIIIASVSNRTVVQEMERKFGEKTEGRKAYEHICGLWALGTDDAGERFTAKDDERKALVGAGPQSGTSHHDGAEVGQLPRPETREVRRLRLRPQALQHPRLHREGRLRGEDHRGRRCAEVQNCD